ncbi:MULTISPECIES: 3-deoxy-7-phosphoheptulonate synthase [unclassified Colwellia]|jgi:3-deoxy-7-phosphoheptulonate synthase|uniref:3-deoxy-7-phosphoheptulonate synthase n=1 Tax=unclassified Colwellia TaxID=196834 RepID=UPI0015F6DDA1|nr:MULTISPECIES: 3-deoxy-7-phosphoheptulonate synthase [unclassified Colwellia]MBA6379397.1 3-deoxy-7-phosphoheptulonate synthase [Colwellia sp. BRX10-7]MBA6388598.1 3-deoxy-7-phosphoheptulonate synthase [Colwellia sp. BRX10-2]MBA6403455.1 3-deoxy-7-phosphoheptulonate synthase [Colwellia sp. BRX10-5]MBA6405839.1 3-deoxy-7-phosphoheptulonate synthase [Colwellia sp. BRX10-1]|tara:strand:- start:136 stop:1197 length:1062 start_codon:yes stop_codon:yes gene_type:complete
MTIKTDEFRTTLIENLVSPEELAQQIPLDDETASFIIQSRKDIEAIITGDDDRLLVIIGPCSIHDTTAAVDYAEKLKVLHDKYRDDLLIVMRVYFEKPRTTVGWKGLISDPDLDKSFHVAKGLNLARSLLMDINKLGLPAGTEFLDMVTGQYISDLISWGAIGARTTESQVHRELASALSCPVGFKNGTDGNVQIAVDAINASSVPHVLYSPNKSGQMCIYQTHGNPFAHVILRGGKEPNYHAENISKTGEVLAKAGLENRIMIDCSHGNSFKDHNKQIDVARSLRAQMEQGDNAIFGVMVESFLVEGNQKVVDVNKLTYGQSITDACINLDTSVSLLDELSAAVQAKRSTQR